MVSFRLSLGGRGGFSFIFELFVTVLLTFNCAERNICCCIHTQMLLSRFNFCHDHMLALVCWTFLSFLGTFEKKRNAARLSPLLEFVPPRCRHTTRRSQRLKAARPSWENHCVMGFCCPVFIRTAFSDAIHCVGVFLLFVFCRSMTPHKRTNKNKPLFFGFKMPLCMFRHSLFYDRFAWKYNKNNICLHLRSRGGKREGNSCLTIWSAVEMWTGCRCQNLQLVQKFC